MIDDAGVPWAAVTFTHRDGESDVRVRLRVPLKVPARGDIAGKIRRARTKTEDQDQIRFEVMEQEAKRIWRVLAHNLKARLVSVDEGVETFEEAFLAHIVDTNTGMTVYEQMVQYGRAELPMPLPASRQIAEATVVPD